MKVKIGYGDTSKLGTRVCTISTVPGKDCQPGVPCRKSCYARRHCYDRYGPDSTISRSWDSNSFAFRFDAKAACESVHAQLSRKPSDLVRWFVGGDFVSAAHAYYANELAKAMPDIRFLAFTKRQYAFPEPPSNYRLIASQWPQYHAPIPEGVSGIAYMRDKAGLEDRIPASAFTCPGSCYECNYHCWGMPKGSVLCFPEH